MTTTPLLLRRLTRRQLQVLDAGCAVLVTALCCYAAAELGPGWQEPAWVTALAGLSLGVPAAIRRSHPMAATALVLAASGLCLASGVIPDFAVAAPIVAVGLVLYTVGTSLTRRRSAVTAVLAVVVIVEALVLAADSPFDPGVGQASAFAALILGLCWALGWTVRERRAYAGQLHRQATARAVDDERLRIAREMHDIVAHSMSLIAVKATIANHVADQRPQEVRDALRVIEATSRTALTELRRTLGALRTEGDLAPVLGITDLPRLVEATTAAGVEVQLDVQDVADLPEGVSLAVFRIVQEGLTNVVKHAAAGHCRVTVAGEPGAVVIEIVDDGGGAKDGHSRPDHRRSLADDRRAGANDGRAGPGGSRAAPEPRRGAAGPEGSDPALRRGGAEETRGAAQEGRGAAQEGRGAAQEGRGAAQEGRGAADEGRGVAGAGGCEPALRPGAAEVGTGTVDADGWNGAVAGDWGQGLIGMRERVALYRGELRAGPQPHGGWMVRATLDTAA